MNEVRLVVTTDSGTITGDWEPMVLDGDMEGMTEEEAMEYARGTIIKMVSGDYDSGHITFSHKGGWVVVPLSKHIVAVAMEPRPAPL